MRSGWSGRSRSRRMKQQTGWREKDLLTLTVEEERTGVAEERDRRREEREAEEVEEEDTEEEKEREEGGSGRRERVRREEDVEAGSSLRDTVAIGKDPQEIQKGCRVRRNG